MDILSNKIFAKKNKNRGLQKLKYYCEMCNRQCKDENGFKLFIEKFSYEFEKCFLDLLRMEYGDKKVLANKVYKDYISDQNHTHMNSTKWATLNSFLIYLQTTNKCTLEETDKGPLISFLDTSPQGIEKRKVAFF